MLRYDTTSTTLMGGFTFAPAEHLELGLDLVWNEADGGLAPFDYTVPPQFESAVQSYDFTRTHLNSDLDLGRLEAGLRASWQLSDRYSLVGSYRYADVTDDAPYIEDLGGTLQRVSLGVGASF